MTIQQSTIDVLHLSKSYHAKQVLKDVTFQVHPGTIVGMVGNNGAGKTTIMKILLGLVRPSAGTAKVNGCALTAPTAQRLRGVGSMIDIPAFYPYLTVQENLRQTVRMIHAADSEIDRVLQLTGMADSKHLAVKKCSMGMKQRLGISRALLGAPKLLILDEPANGLDPNGTIQFRELLLRLKSDGVTILLSSHMLSEIEKLCDKIIYLTDGVIRQEIAANEYESQTCVFQSADAVKARELLKSANVVRGCGGDGTQVTFTCGKNTLPQMINLLLSARIDVQNLQVTEHDLEHTLFAEEALKP